MAKLTGDRDTQSRAGRYIRYLVAAAAVIWAGSLVGIDGSGHAVPLDDDAALRFAGVAREHVDNSAGAAGDLGVDCWIEGVFEVAGSGFVQADVRKPVYALTDQDVALAAGVDHDVFVGTIVEVTSATSVWVKIDVQGRGDASDIAVLEADVTALETDVSALETDVAALQGQTAALGAENTDGEVPIPILAGTADGGTWTKAVTAGGLESVTRTAADAPDSYWIPIIIPHRTSAGKGVKPTGLKANYEVDGADVADVRFEVWAVNQGADGAARTAAVLFGEAEEDYDAAHDTAVKRGDDTAGPELHQVVVTDAGAPAYLAAGKSLRLRVYVDGDAGPNGVVKLTSAVLLYAETLVDVA